MTEEENIHVAAPEKWMNGWDSIYKRMLDAPDEELNTEFPFPYSY
ncbi:MAG: hypothetical protein ACTSQZ_09930 [Candidatus Thorarchaeota archaeon]